MSRSLEPKDYRRALEDGFTETYFSEPQTRLNYLGDHIFNFVTYDGEMSELFASKAMEVCAAISDGKTFEYIQDADNYRWFLLMCNMPFFESRLSWGTSIRGAWWDARHGGIEFDSCGLFLGGQQITDTLTFTEDQWREFIAAILEFGQETGGPRV